MIFENDLKFDYKDVLIKPKRSTLSSRSEVDITRTITFKNNVIYNGVPIISANMDTVSTFEMADALKENNMSSAIHKFYSKEELIDFFSKNENNKTHWYTLGITQKDLKKFEEVNNSVELQYISIDVANAYQESFVNFIKKFTEKYPNKVVMAGNVVSAEMTEELILAGASIISIGIGPGSACVTRIKTGVGLPQLSAVIECADAAHGLGGYVCADGGITCAGDIAKAFGAGADFVMIGGMFAAHDECGGEIITKKYRTNEIDETGKRIIEEKKFMKFYAMSSE